MIAARVELAAGARSLLGRVWSREQVRPVLVEELRTEDEHYGLAMLLHHRFVTRMVNGRLFTTEAGECWLLDAGVI